MLFNAKIGKHNYSFSLKHKFNLQTTSFTSPSTSDKAFLFSRIKFVKNHPNFDKRKQNFLLRLPDAFDDCFVTCVKLAHFVSFRYNTTLVESNLIVRRFLLDFTFSVTRQLCGTYRKDSKLSASLLQSAVKSDLNITYWRDSSHTIFCSLSLVGSKLSQAQSKGSTHSLSAKLISTKSFSK